MDLTLFINSRDVRDHHRRIGYEYNAAEAAWLVYQSQDANYRDRHEAWTWIIENMPDMKFDCLRKYDPYKDTSVHETLKAYMELEDKFVAEFKAGGEWVYSYSELSKSVDGGYSYFDRSGVFSSWDECVKYAVSDADPEYTRSIEVYRDILNDGKNVRRHGSIEIDLKGEILCVNQECNDVTPQDEAHLQTLFEDMWFEFPVPFKKGDMVYMITPGSRKAPIVLTGAVIPPWRDAEEYREKRRKSGGDFTDMNIWGYSMETTRSYSDAGESGYLGVYSEVWWNYMDVEYYRDELQGMYRALLPLQAWLRGELGDDMCLLLAAYHRVLLEEYLAQTVPTTYMKDQMKKIGIDVP